MGKRICEKFHKVGILIVTRSLNARIWCKRSAMIGGEKTDKMADLKSPGITDSNTLFNKVCMSVQQNWIGVLQQWMKCFQNV